MGIGAPDPSGGGGDPTGGMMPPGGAGGGQGVQIIQQIQQLLAQLMQTESDPGVQKAVQSMLQLCDPLQQAIGQADAGSMSSGIANPGGPPEGSPAEEASEPPAEAAAEGDPTSFGGASKAASANFKAKGHFSKSGSKGETLQTDKTKNRNKK